MSRQKHTGLVQGELATLTSLSGFSLAETINGLRRQGKDSLSAADEGRREPWFQVGAIFFSSRKVT